MRATRPCRRSGPCTVLATAGRKETLVNFGFPACRRRSTTGPLKFEEFERLIRQAIYVSATPSNYELERSQGVVVEQIIRPDRVGRPRDRDPAGADPGGRSAPRDPRPGRQERARVGDHPHQANGRGPHRALRRRGGEACAICTPTSTPSERSALIRDLRAGGLRRAGGHQPAARRARHPRSVAGGNPRRRQGGLPTLVGVAHPARWGAPPAISGVGSSCTPTW